MDEVNEQFVSAGEFIKNAREQNKITLQQLSEQTKLSIQRIQDIEANKYPVNMVIPSYIRGQIKMLCEVLDLEINEVNRLLELDGFMSHELFINNTTKSHNKSKIVFNKSILFTSLSILISLTYLFWKNPTENGVMQEPKNPSAPVIPTTKNLLEVKT